jgi:DNA sulfur modification protein DndC
MMDLIRTSAYWKQESISSKNDNKRLLENIEETKQIITKFFYHGYNHWIITFSGGKDSTTTVILALETILQENLPIQRVDIVYSDTLIEIPVIYQYALKFLNFLKQFERIKSLSIFYHIVQPRIEDRFWVCLLGRGYPPPHQRFRWCTQRLKINPVEAALKAYIQPNRTIILTGVRFGESVARDQRMSLSCQRGGECGQGVWFQHSSRLQAAYLAPIAYWQECDVWDFLNFVAPQWGYPTHLLSKEVYNGQNLRFGCWMCTVVSQDRTMERLVSQPQWAHLRPLLDFRGKIIEVTRSMESRLLRPDGTPGRLSLETRRKLLEELLLLQSTLGMTLISDEEVSFIQRLWEDERYQDYSPK